MSAVSSGHIYPSAQFVQEQSRALGRKMELHLSFPCPPQAAGPLLLLPEGGQSVKHAGGEGDGVAEECGQRQAEHDGEHSHPAGTGAALSAWPCSPRPAGVFPSPGCAPGSPPGPCSPAVEGCFLPGSQLVGPGGNGVGELDELAAERGLAQEQDEGVEPPERANQG